MSVRRLLVCSLAAAVCAASTMLLPRGPSFQARAMETRAIRARLESAYHTRTRGQECPKAPVQTEFWPLSEPAYGQPVRLVLSVLPFEPGPAAEIGFDVPEGVRCSGQRLRRGLTLPADRLAQFAIDVVVERPGTYRLEAWAIMGEPSFRFGRRVRLFLDASTDGIRVSDAWDYDQQPQHGSANFWPQEPPTQPPPRNPDRDARLPLPYVPDGVDTPRGIAGGTDATTMWGYVYWYDGDNHPAFGTTIQGWDLDSFSAADYLGAALVDENGYWAIAFDNDTDGWFETGTADFYAVCYSLNSSVGVATSGGSVYSYTGNVIYDVGPGAQYYETWQLSWAWGTEAGAFRINAILTKGYVDLYYFGQPHPTVALWSNGSTDGTYYDPSTDRIHLRSFDANSPDVVLHEYAHSSMDTLYKEDYIPYTPTGDRSPTAHTSPNAAMAEGYATFLSCFLGRKSTYEDHNPGNWLELDLEPNWDGYGTANGNVDGLSTGANSGHDTEASVASLFWDIDDEAQDRFDFLSGGITYIVGALYDYHPRTAQAFFNGWRSRNPYQTQLAGQMQVHGMDQGSTLPTFALLYNVSPAVNPWYWSGPGGVRFKLQNYGSLPYPIKDFVATLTDPSGKDLSPQLGAFACANVPTGDPLTVQISVPHLNPVDSPVLGNYTVHTYYHDSSGVLQQLPLASNTVQSSLTMNVVGDPDAPDFCDLTLPYGPPALGENQVKIHVESKDLESDIAGYYVRVTGYWGWPTYFEQFVSARGSTSWDQAVACSPLPGGEVFLVSVWARNVMGMSTAAMPVQFRLPRAVQGLIALQDWVPSPSGRSATIEVRHVGSSSALETHAVVLGDSGSYSFQSALTGTYDLVCRSGHWLRRKLGGVSFTTETVEASFSLVNGDVDQDNAVTVFDYNALSDAFDSTQGDANWNAGADLDGDGAVTVYDYNIISTNFDKVGDD